MSPKVGIVTTTIFVPSALVAYAENARQHGHEDVVFVVTGDKGVSDEKVAACKGVVEEITSRFQYEAMYMTPDEQEQYLKVNCELLITELPWKCIQRRNVSILKAYELGCEVIITMDDDNYFVPGQDFVGEHCKFLTGPRVARHGLDVLESSSGWLNICQYLEDVRHVPYYPRGYPMPERFPWPQEKAPITRLNDDESEKTRRVVVNGGLWLNDPDVDAITRLANDIHATHYTRESSFVLATSTWCPFNSQNTALHRDVIPAYMVSWTVGRYDDIWPSYITRRIADHLGDSIAFGFPLVNQERNPHNYFVDLAKEVTGLEFTDLFCKWLREFELSGRDYHTCYGELIPLLSAKIAAHEWSPKNQHVKTFFEGFVQTMEVWHKVFQGLVK